MNCLQCVWEEAEVFTVIPQNRAEVSLVGKKCARMSADFRCGRHVESNQTRGNFIGVNMAEYEIEPLKVL
jgi:hypothetical protein